jgi:hypothetical protein
VAGQAFQTSVDICNRALQRVGARRIMSFTDGTPSASEVSFCYDKLRRAELRRNLWTFSIRRVLLRPLGTALQTWDPTLSYSTGAYTTYGGVNYVATDDNTNSEPDLLNDWDIFTGTTTLKITFSAWDNMTAYTQGQIVTGSDSRLWQLIAPSDTGDDPTLTSGIWAEYFGNVTATQYDSTQGYGLGELVFYPEDNTIWSSGTNGNTNDPELTYPNGGWVQQTCTFSPAYIQWPAQTGPQTDNTTKNVFFMPSGYLRVAPQAPDAGRNSFLGYPGNIPSTDWTFEGGLLLSMTAGAIMFRFAADVIDVTTMDDMFCEGLSCRVGLEVCEKLTQSDAKLKAIDGEYKVFMGDARATNGIEQGSVEPPLDDYIATRL